MSVLNNALVSDSATITTNMKPDRGDNESAMLQLAKQQGRKVARNISGILADFDLAESGESLTEIARDFADIDGVTVTEEVVKVIGRSGYGTAKFIDNFVLVPVVKVVFDFEKDNDDSVNQTDFDAMKDSMRESMRNVAKEYGFSVGAYNEAYSRLTAYAQRAVNAFNSTSTEAEPFVLVVCDYANDETSKKARRVFEGFVSWVQWSNVGYRMSHGTHSEYKLAVAENRWEDEIAAAENFVAEVIDAE